MFKLTRNKHIEEIQSAEKPQVVQETVNGMKNVLKLWNEEQCTMEFTDKMESCEIDGKYDIILDIVKVNTDEEIGE